MLLFALCALVPLVIFATLSVTRVSDQVRADTAKNLHNSAMTSGMGIVARLNQVAVDLTLAGNLTRDWHFKGQWSSEGLLERQLERRSAALWRIEGDEGEAVFGDAVLPNMPMTPAEREHVAAGNPLVQVFGDSADLYMTRDLDPDDGLDARLVLLVRREWFWDPQELRGVNCEFAACDKAGNVLYHTFRTSPAAQLRAAAITREVESGSIEWHIDGEPHVGRYWAAFLRPQYGVDLWVVQSRSQRDAFATDDAFVRWFWLTAIGTLLCVVLGSLVQMRRTLDPIVSLREATQRIGRGDLDHRVWIESRDEFGELGTAFNEMAQRLQENIAQRERTEHELVASRDAALAAVKAKAEFVTNVSHEFRTPMAEILGATEILTQMEESEDPGVLEEFSGMALHGAQRLARLLDDVLELGQVTNGTKTSVDIRASLEQAISGMQPEVRARVSFDVRGALPAVVGDGNRLTEVWGRLVDNAAKFSDESTTIEVTATFRGVEIVVDVMDHGTGIAPADIDRVFEPFSQVGRDQMVNKAHGTGLGLTLARSTVDSHGGSISVRSAIGEGSTFRVRLPVEQPVGVIGAVVDEQSAAD